MIRLALLAVFAVAPAVPAQDKVAVSAHFPAAEGTAWTYKLGEKKITIRVTKHEKQASAMAARFDTFEKNDLLAFQHIAIAADAVKRVAHNGEAVTPPLVLLKVPPAKGQSWDVDSKMTSR